MKTLKKWLALLLAGVMLASTLASCGNDPSTEPDEEVNFDEYKGLTPEEVYDKLLDASQAVLTVKSVLKSGDDKDEWISKFEIDGKKLKETYESDDFSSVSYIDFKKGLSYIEDDSGEWITTDAYYEDWEDLLEDILEPDFFFEDNHYEEDGDRFDMTEDALNDYIDDNIDDMSDILGEDFELTVYMEREESTYTFIMEAENREEDVTVSSEIEIEFKEVSVKLPKVDDETPSVGPNDATVSEKIPADLNFSDLSEEERTIRIAYVEGYGTTLTEHSLVVDEDNMNASDKVDVAVKSRNDKVEAQLGVKLEAVKVSNDIGALSDAVKDYIMAGYGEYDILAGYQYYSLNMAYMNGGLLLDLKNDLPEAGADYIDFDAPYWATDYNNAISYKDSYYWITGDIALRYMGGMYCTYVNSLIYTDLLEDNYGNIYDIAKEGRWNLDLMMEMAALCYQDDGNFIHVTDSLDQIGFGYEMQDPIDALALASGAQFSYKDPNTGDVQITFMTQNTIDISNKLTTLLKADYSYDYGASDSANVMSAFAAGNVAFTVNKLFISQDYLSEFRDFYVIPAPMYDDNQSYYITGLHDGVTLFAIPKDCKKVPQAAAALELMAAYSAQYVTPVYYNSCLKSRYVRDPEAAEMVDLIAAYVTTDFAAAWSNSLNNIAHAFRTTSKIDSYYFARYGQGYVDALNALIEELEYASGE